MRIAPRSKDATLGEVLDARSMPEPNSGCLLWTGTIGRSGYGQLRWQGHTRSVHRLAWEHARGPIPDGLCVCHRCDVPVCINPDHLWLGTNADNVADRESKARNKPMRGEANGMAKLTAQQIRGIRADTRAHRIIAADYRVSPALVCVIRKRQVWQHVQNEDHR